MNLLMKLKADLLELSKKQCASVKNQNLVPEDLHLYYALHEYNQICGKIRKIVDDRLKVGVTWDQVSALHIRVTGTQGRYDRAAKKVERFEKALQQKPSDEVVLKNLESANKSLKRALEELTLMDDLSAKVAAYKNPKEVENNEKDPRYEK